MAHSFEDRRPLGIRRAIDAVSSFETMLDPLDDNESIASPAVRRASSAAEYGIPEDSEVAETPSSGMISRNTSRNKVPEGRGSMASLTLHDMGIGMLPRMHGRNSLDTLGSLPIDLGISSVNTVGFGRELFTTTKVLSSYTAGALSRQDDVLREKRSMARIEGHSMDEHDAFARAIGLVPVNRRGSTDSSSWGVGTHHHRRSLDSASPEDDSMQPTRSSGFRGPRYRSDRSSLDSTLDEDEHAPTQAMSGFRGNHYRSDRSSLDSTFLAPDEDDILQPTRSAGFRGRRYRSDRSSLDSSFEMEDEQSHPPRDHGHRGHARGALPMPVPATHEDPSHPSTGIGYRHRGLHQRGSITGSIASVAEEETDSWEIPTRLSSGLSLSTENTQNNASSATPPADASPGVRRRSDPFVGRNSTTASGTPTTPQRLAVPRFASEPSAASITRSSISSASSEGSEQRLGHRNSDRPNSDRMGPSGAKSGRTQKPRGSLNSSDASECADGSNTYSHSNPSADFVHDFFRPGTSALAIQRQHLNLGRVAFQIFVLTEEEPKVPAGRMSIYWHQFGGLPTVRRWYWCRGRILSYLHKGSLMAGRLCTRPPFVLFYLILTLYTLFLPDVLGLLGREDLRDPFRVVNTVVFGLFVVELALLVAGNRNYKISAFIVFDVICLVSLLADTVIVGSNEDLGPIGSEDNFRMARMARVARFSRSIRLVRLGRLARLVRMLPRMLPCMKNPNLELAQQVLLRRLWRGFYLLDVDKDGLISEFDFKVYYIIILKACHPCMLRHHPADLINIDKDLIESNVSPEIDAHVDDVHGQLDFFQFSQVMLQSRLGQDLVKHHVVELERKEGVWALTQKLGDNTTLKVFTAVLCMLFTLSLLDMTIPDGAAQAGLAQLDQMARAEAEAALGGLDLGLGYLCRQIGTYQAKISTHFLHIAGKSFVGADCESGHVNATIVEARSMAESLWSSARSRNLLLELHCVAHGAAVSCEDWGSASSLALVDVTDAEHERALWSFVETIAMFTSLMCIAFFLNRKIDDLGSRIIKPLRWLVDDMLGLSSLDLLSMHQDDMPGEVAKTIEEMDNLRAAFMSMRGAIHGWSMFVPPMVVQRIFSSGVEADIGVHPCHVTMLFCDIVKFDELCEQLLPHEIIDLLSAVGNLVAEAIQSTDGTLLEFIGDETVSVFNVPNRVSRHYVSAVDAAREIHRAIDNHNPFVSSAGKQVEIQCRCGVHTANVLAGNIGSRQRIKYGCLGDGMNLTARLKGLNTRYGSRTLISNSTMHPIQMLRQHSLHYRPVDKVAVKGKAEPTTVYEVFPLYKHEDNRTRLACEMHTTAFKHYQEQRFQEAADVFSEVESMLNTAGYERDVPSRLLRRRCLEYLKEPPPPDWDGVDRLNLKTFEVDDEPDPPKLLAKNQESTRRASNASRRVSFEDQEASNVSVSSVSALVEVAEFDASSSGHSAGCMQGMCFTAAAKEEGKEVKAI